MGSQDKSNRRSIQGTKCKGLCNDDKRGRSPKPMVGQTTQSWTHCGIEVEIHGTLFLYSKERQFITASSRLQEVKPDYYKEQNTTTSNWRSYRQTQGSEILQQTRFDLGIQQRTNQGRR